MRSRTRRCAGRHVRAAGADGRPYPDVLRPPRRQAADDAFADSADAPVGPDAVRDVAGVDAQVGGDARVGADALVGAPEAGAEDPEAAASGQAGWSTRKAYLVTGLGALVVPAAAFLTSPLLARALGPDGRGALSASIAPVVFAGMAASAGLPDAVTHFIAKHPAAARRYLWSATAATVQLGIVAFVAVWLLSPVLMRQYPHDRALLVLLAATLPVSLLTGIARAVAQGLQEFRLVALERWLSVGLRVGLLVAFQLAGALTVAAAAWITWGTALVVGAVYARPLLRTRTMAWQPARAGLYGYAGHSWIAGVAALLVLRLDQVLLAPMAGPEQLGFYAVAVAIAEVPNTVVGQIRQVALSRGSSAGTTALIPATCRVVAFAALVVAAAGSLAAPVVIPWFFGGDFGPAVSMAQILLFASVPAAVNAVASAGLSASGRPGLQSAAQFAGLAVTVPLLLFTVPRMGADGAALASLAAYATAGGTALVLFCRRSGVSLRSCLVLGGRDLDLLLLPILLRLPGTPPPGRHSTRRPT